MMTDKSSLIWLFDLDNTLHRADHGIFQLINQKMTAYLAKHLNLSWQKSSDLRQDYWHRYGATLAGLRLHHPHIDVYDFLYQSHPVELIRQLIVVEKELLYTLKNLSGQFVVFSNGPSYYVELILEELNIRNYFTHAFGCDHFELLYKPNPHAYHIILEKIQTQAKQCIMVDDSINNLLTAKQLGMKTIHYCDANRPAESVTYIDYSIQQFQQLLTLDIVN